MLTVEELISQYSGYTDKELYDVHVNIEGYSDEAREALEKVVKKRGGLESLIARLKDEQKIEAEKVRIATEVNMLGMKGVDVSFMIATIQSDILSPKQVAGIIDHTYRQVQLEIEDSRIKSRTVFGGLIGTVLASLIGGALWGLRLIYGPQQAMEIRIELILLFGLLLVCYGIIKLCVRQSWKNSVVLIGIVLSFLLAIFLGMRLFDVIGPR